MVGCSVRGTGVAPVGCGSARVRPLVGPASRRITVNPYGPAREKPVGVLRRGVGVRRPLAQTDGGDGGGRMRTAVPF